MYKCCSNIHISGNFRLHIYICIYMICTCAVHTYCLYMCIHMYITYNTYICYLKNNERVINFFIIRCSNNTYQNIWGHCIWWITKSRINGSGGTRFTISIVIIYIHAWWNSLVDLHNQQLCVCTTCDNYIAVCFQWCLVSYTICWYFSSTYIYIDLYKSQELACVQCTYLRTMKLSMKLMPLATLMDWHCLDWPGVCFMDCYSEILHLLIYVP